MCAHRTLKTATVNWYTRNCAYTHRSLIKPNQVMNLSHFSSKFYLCLRFCVCVCPDLLICELYRVWHSALGVFVSVLVTTEKYVEIFHPNNCGTFSNVYVLCTLFTLPSSKRDISNAKLYLFTIAPTAKLLAVFGSWRIPKYVCQWFSFFFLGPEEPHIVCRYQT